MLHVVTVATHAERYFSVLQESCHRHNINIIVLGWDEKYTGHFMKDALVYKYITGPQVEENDIVCFVDGFDSVVLADSYAIENTFKKLRVPILVSADRIKWYKNPLMWYLYYRVFGNQRLNTGMYIGYAYALQASLQLCIAAEYSTRGHTSNQKIWNEVHKRVPKLFELDENSKVFLNYWTFFGTCVPSTLPCVMSCPANGNMNCFLRKLGYANIPKRTFTIKTFLKCKHYIFLFSPELALLYFLFTKAITICNYVTYWIS